MQIYSSVERMTCPELEALLLYGFGVRCYGSKRQLLEVFNVLLPEILPLYVLDEMGI